MNVTSPIIKGVGLALPYSFSSTVLLHHSLPWSMDVTHSLLPPTYLLPTYLYLHLVLPIRARSFSNTHKSTTEGKKHNVKAGWTYWYKKESGARTTSSPIQLWGGTCSGNIPLQQTRHGWSPADDRIPALHNESLGIWGTCSHVLPRKQQVQLGARRLLLIDCDCVSAHISALPTM